ncbi:unnamed protein product [Brachionus calyciflorus]|uniref:Nuclear receptor domain-containing protein n=1 Tax=Brachionus calyciflorus TaxID=104777 RepID=A0A814LQQ6_9BILA|nr:unnamed protein product [Brachionus calyciflorus]
MSLLYRKSEPCRICGETGTTGWYCGTITCEACKKFFMRSVKSDYLQLKCVRSNSNCVITKSTRTNCGHCRFQKCLQVGMKLNDKTEVVEPKKIPCSVCGDASSGFHFGAFTCEGCKGFFLRYKNKKITNESCPNRNICQINFSSRNQCKSCRFHKCLTVGMAKNNSKSGRQTNLFKQKIMSQLDQGSPNVHTPHICQPQITLFDFDVENKIYPNLIYLVKNISQAYVSLLYIDTLTPKENVSLLIFDTIRTHLEQCFYFIKQTKFLRKFNENDQNIILINSIHSLRLLQLISLEQNSSELEFQLNYFNCCKITYEKITKFWPIFEQIMVYFKPLVEYVRELKLDVNEFAIYSLFLVFSSSCKNLIGFREKFECNLELCNLLCKYMYLRRNENESSEKLINIAPRFERINLQIQMGIYEKCNELIKMGFNLEKYYQTIFMSQFTQ